MQYHIVKVFSEQTTFLFTVAVILHCPHCKKPIRPVY